MRFSDRSDLFGAGVSGLCAIHCTLTPLFFAARPLLEGTLHGHAHGGIFWASLDYLFLILSLLAVGYSARHTHRSSVRRALWAAWGTFALGLLLEPFGIPYSKGLMYAGSIALIITHIRNYTHCRHGTAESCE